MADGEPDPLQAQTPAPAPVVEVAPPLTAAASPAKQEIHATFAGIVDQQALHRIFGGVSEATKMGLGTVHLLFQSTGGAVGDGVCLYNYLRALPVDLCLYNVGFVGSIAVVAYLGAKVRRASAGATFMLHKSTVFPPTGIAASRIQPIGRQLELDDQRTEAILREHLTMPDELWEVHRVTDLWLSAQEALEYGLVTEIADFSPTFGKPIYNL
jgi:ATP-dependent Clp protease, protease subunit